MAVRHEKMSIGARLAGIFCLLAMAVVCVGFGINSAGANDALPNAFGLSQLSTDHVFKDQEEESPSDGLVQEASDTTYSLSLQTSARRDITRGLDEIYAEQEAARIAAEEAARAEEEARIAAEKAHIAEVEASMIEVYDASVAATLTDVDWSVGKDAFIATWTERINAYLKGFPLEGMGEAFAKAAWEYGVDPRWSPAISNTESTRGQVCFKPHNAWGWGQSSWSSWEEAIDAHVKGLSEAYGYTISYRNAMKYCPPNFDHWFHDTLGQMTLI